MATTVTSTMVSYNHEAAVLEAIHVAHKNRRVSMGNMSHMSSTSMNGSTRSCLKDGSGRRRLPASRRVSFCDKGHHCQEFEMYTEKESEAVWFAPEDYDEMKQSFEFTVFMMDAGCPEKVEDDVEHTTRGLEKRCEEGQWKRYERKRDYYDAVLDEQERQWEEDFDDYDKISQIAIEVTRDSFVEAQNQGVMDEIAIYGHSLRARGGPGQPGAACRSISRRSVSDNTAETQDENDSWPSETEQD